jgi:sec-independent protein translocase protein TatA
MFGLGSQEILLILLILVVLFGAKRLPAIGKGLGETLKEIRNIRGERKAEKEKEKTKEEQKGSLVSEIKKDIEELPGLKEAREIKETTDKIKSVTKLLK